MDKIAAGDAKPGQIVTVFGEKYWIRYIYHGAKSVSLALQPHNEPLSPFHENDVIIMTIDRPVIIEVE